ncbi:MAG: right-handed parallel beta-helix repeat-containing protein [Parabacteroides sp.]|nr:right-handed parallel beta-helix repeat-containing protein [Parabacteroides sp.]
MFNNYFIYRSLMFISFCLSGLFIQAQTFFIATSGDDNAPGTRDKPLASIIEARDRIRELRNQKKITDTVYVKIFSGNYYLAETLTFSEEDTGTPQSPTVYTSVTDERPVLYGGMETGRFEIINPNLWRVFIPEVAMYGLYFEQLYINGERRFRAQSPNRGDFNMVKRVEETVIDSSIETLTFAVQKVVLHEDAFKFLNKLDTKELNDALMVFYHKWDNTRKMISHTNIKDTAIYLVGQPMYTYNKLDDNSRYVLENLPAALDAPGEWFLQRDGNLYYIPMPGEKPENISCMFPIIEQHIIIQGNNDKFVEHVRFENLSFQLTAYHTPKAGNMPAQAAAPIEATVMIDNARNIDFLNCEIAHTGIHAIWFRENCSFSKVERCHLYDLGGGGVKIGTQGTPHEKRITNNITVNNNIIQHGGFVFPASVGVIIFKGYDNVITHNDIANFRYTGISCGWVWGYAHSPTIRNKIEFNHIHHLGWGELSDMGGVYTLGDSEGTTVSNNVIHHIYSYDYGGWGLYTDEGTKNILMENNLVYACKNAGFHQHYGKDNIIRNNIFALIKTSAIQISRVEEHLSYTFTNNIIYQDTGDLISDVWGGDNGTKIKVIYDNNCYWKIGDPSPEFYGLSFVDWKKIGKDKNSIIANPQFVNPINYDFRFKNTSVARKIKFKPFDYTQAGVYGSEAWKEKARIPKELEKAFDEAVKKIVK